MSAGVLERAPERLPAGAARRLGTTLYVVDGLGLSGKTKALADLATGLDPARYRAVVCCRDEERSPLARRLRDRGIRLHEVPGRDGLDFPTVARLMRLMREVEPDVVHCYNPRTMLYAGLAARLAGIRGTLGTLSAFSCQVPDRAYPFLPQPLFTRSPRNRWRNRLACGLMRYVVAVSPSLGERFCRYNGVSLEKLQVAPYGANVELVWQHAPEEVEALRRRLGYGPEDVVIGSVGRLVEQKDYPTQLRAFALASQQAPALRMALAGDGPLREPLEQLVRELQVQDRVQFLGHWEAVPLLLRTLDIFVLASKFEPYGVALLEAKAAGLAIAATRVNEVPEIVIEGQSGLLAPAEAPERLAEVFVRLAEDRDLRERLGRRALQEAREQHSLEAMVRKYEQLYDALRGQTG